MVGMVKQALTRACLENGITVRRRLARPKATRLNHSHAAGNQVVVTNQTSSKMIGPDGNPANFDTGSRMILTSQMGEHKSSWVGERSDDESVCARQVATFSRHRAHTGSSYPEIKGALGVSDRIERLGGAHCPMLTRPWPCRLARLISSPALASARDQGSKNKVQVDTGAAGKSSLSKEQLKVAFTIDVSLFLPFVSLPNCLSCQDFQEKGRVRDV